MSILFLHFFFHKAISCAASAGAEAFPSACFRLYELRSAHRTATVLFTPDRIIQLCEFAGTCKPVRFTEKLNLIDFQAERFCNCPVSDALHTHCPDLFFLRFRHMLSPRNRRCFAVFGIHTGSAKTAIYKCGKMLKMGCFHHVLCEKSPFFP